MLKKSKRTAKKTAHTRMFKLRRKRNSSIVKTVMLKQINQIFPDRMLCKVNCAYQLNTLGNAGATNIFAIGGNFLHNHATVSLATNITTANFATAVPISGIGALLANTSSTTNYAPYASYRIHASRIEVECNTEGAAGSNASVIVWPVNLANLSTIPAISGLGINTMYEQPYVKHKTIPAAISTVIPKVVNFMSTRKIFGLKYRSLIEAAEYAGGLGFNPSSTWCWIVVSDPVTTAATPMNFISRVEYTIEFFNRVYDQGFSV